MHMDKILANYNYCCCATNKVASQRSKVAIKQEQNKFICYAEREQLHEGEARIIVIPSQRVTPICMQVLSECGH